MSYTLYGSKTSPIVRRIRLLLEGIPYTFQEMDIYGADKEAIKQINPISQVPVFTDGDQKVWDSRQIFNYLNQKHNFQKLSLDDENTLTAIDGALNAGVTLFLMRRSGIDINADIMYVQRLKMRMENILDYLKPQIEGEYKDSWNFITISLYCFLDWATFREILSIENKPECRAFLESHLNRPGVVASQIPKV